MARIIDLETKKLFGRETTDLKDKEVKRFTDGLRNYAAKFKGRIGRFEFTERTLRITVANDKVCDGIVEYLGKQNVEVVEVDLLDEWFASKVATATNK